MSSVNWFIMFSEQKHRSSRREQAGLGEGVVTNGRTKEGNGGKHKPAKQSGRLERALLGVQVSVLIVCCAG